MAARRSRGIRVLELPIEKPADIPRALWNRAAQNVAIEMETRMQLSCNRPNPTGKFPSKPGEYPKAVSGDLRDGINVVYSERSGELRAYSATMHGVYLEDPARTRPDGRREWATKGFAARDWEARVDQLARAIQRGER